MMIFCISTCHIFVSWKKLHASLERASFLCNGSCRNKKMGLLTWSAVSFWWSDVTIRAGANWLVIDYFTIRISTARIPNDTRVNTLTVLTCVVKWTIFVIFATNGKLWGGGKFGWDRIKNENIMLMQLSESFDGCSNLIKHISSTYVDYMQLGDFRRSLVDICRKRRGFCFHI